MVDRTSLERVKECLKRGQRFVLTTHVNPDGDGLGVEAALAAFLAGRGKDVFIFNSSPVPRNYKFLDPDRQMLVYESKRHRETLLTADYIIVLDISDWGRLKQVGEDIQETKIKKICIDHHPSNGKFGDVNLIDVKACSTGEIVYDLLKFCKAEITKSIADALYTSIMTDTGSFRFSNTTPRAFTISGELFQFGANPHKVHQEVNEKESLSKVKLFGHMLRNLRLELDGKVAIMSVTKDFFERLGAKPYDTEGFADFPRKINGVEVAVMLIERERNKVKMSLRSKGNYVINGIAQKFGGGGHPFAAGALLHGDLERLAPKVLEEVSHLLKINKG